MHAYIFMRPVPSFFAKPLCSRRYEVRRTYAWNINFQWIWKCWQGRFFSSCNIKEHVSWGFSRRLISASKRLIGHISYNVFPCALPCRKWMLMWHLTWLACGGSGAFIRLWTKQDYVFELGVICKSYIFLWASSLYNNNAGIIIIGHLASVFFLPNAP